MAPAKHISANDSGSDSDAPEAVTLSNSASAAKGRDRALKEFHTAEKQKARERNRRRDERLKAQAEGRRRTPATMGQSKLDAEDHEEEDNEGGSDEDARLHARMARAMGDAEWGSDESGAESEGEWGGVGGPGEERLRGVSADEDEDEDVGMSEDEEYSGAEDGTDEDMGGKEGSESDEDEDDATLEPLSSKYLPDHLFTAALSKPRPAETKRTSQATPQARPVRKRRRVHPRAKDVVLGSRTVRTLSPSSAGAPTPASGTTAPPARVNKFLANALALKSVTKKNSKVPPRWERRAPHLGVHKRTTGAPVSGFARQRWR
ncbi:hypothetical protein BC834DRAFT_843066 [Gloeopeniophorella convolvens]|nr:hypothetical protein BC834DRAFT_843066 [Gloeopeniophorella convolvens]